MASTPSGEGAGPTAVHLFDLPTNAFQLVLSDPSLETGEWEAVDPIGTIYGTEFAQPEDDATNGAQNVKAFITQNGIEGGILQMINHGVITGALFLCIGMIYERTHSRMIEDYGGLSKTVPVYIVFFTIFTLAAIGLPGMNAFVGEFLIISGAFKANMIIAVLSILGIVLGACYMVWLYYRVALNEINTTTQSSLIDLDLREIATLAPLVLLVLLIGLQPNMLLSYMHVSVEHLLEQLHNSSIQLESNNAYDTLDSIAEYIKALFKWV